MIRKKTKSFKMQEIRVVIKPFPVFDDSHYSPESLAAACYIYKKKMNECLNAVLADGVFGYSTQKYGSRQFFHRRLIENKDGSVSAFWRFFFQKH